MSKSKTKTQVTHITGSGNKNGGNFGAGVKVTHDVKPNVQIYGQGDINRNQSFKGKGGQTTGSGQIGLVIKY